VESDGRSAIGRFWLNEPIEVASESITLVVWGERTLERHPAGQFWINGRVEVLERT
jgi:hypothetical protein